MAALDVLTVQPESKHAKRNDAIKVVQQALGDAELATLSLEDLENPPEPSKASPTPTGPSYTCVTELPDPSSVASILVGFFDHTPRWKLNSVINFATYAHGYPTPADAVYAAKKLIEAAEEWNSYKIGVTFKWVPKLEDAAFVLEYGGPKGNVLASAFFPNNKPLNTMHVYSFGFDKTDQGGFTNFGIMKNVFLHELGHVLGLRHEFALTEGGAVRFGSKNPDSVMSHKFPPEVQPSDIEGTKAFLTLPPVRDFVPDN
ncbi:hypothetical protein EPUS_08112 [Endocarpon pusillum Z07020]|uniref:Peptidase metallopeptidase domain-containing protein n=1 Tax=Endocarpon pusillum (strain Z07020 / HMAS-L-300199) TaxID=1263415 RepID=U1HXA6_ENDPU|nr:uncharacterized protein EPUS_08112 [Endocarpon pusillum Z07020]ERF74064.1 hypothetical protein EPUS_08112 [Endocarpon pusillum Z07020]